MKKMRISTSLKSAFQQSRGCGGNVLRVGMKHMDRLRGKSEKSKENIILVNPFRNMFNEIHKFSSVWIREYKKSDALLKSLAFINYERSIKIVKGDDIYVIPCIDDVKDFLKITADNIGLRVNERNLLLKLQKEFAFDLDRIAEIGRVISEENVPIRTCCDNFRGCRSTVNTDDNLFLTCFQSKNGRGIFLFLCKPLCMVVFRKEKRLECTLPRLDLLSLQSLLQLGKADAFTG